MVSKIRLILLISLILSLIISTTFAADVLVNDSSQINNAITIQSNKPGNLFYSNETAALKITITHLPPTITRFSFDWELKDTALKMIDSGHHIMSRTNADGFIFPIKLTAPADGWYGLSVTLKSLDKSTVREPLLQTRTGLIWMPAPDAAKTDLQTGIGMSHGFNNISTEQADVLTQLAHTAGIKWFQQLLNVHPIETANNEWNWKEYDSTIEYAQKNRLNQLGILIYSVAGDIHNNDHFYQNYSYYVSQVVNRYKGFIKYWEINKGSNSTLLRVTPEQYTEILKTAYKAAKTADPESKILMCLPEGIDTTLILNIFNAGGYPLMDGISIHPGWNTYPEDSTFEQDLQWCQNIMKQYDRSTTAYHPKELWMNERTMATTVPEGSPEVGLMGTTDGLSEAVQASYLIRSILSKYMTGMVDKFFYPYFKNSNGSPLGVLYHDLSPKPAYLALWNMTRELRGYSYLSTLKTTDNCRYFLFSKGEQKMLVAWCIRGSATVALRADTRTITLTDIYGKQLTQLATNNNLFTINLTEAPVYLTGDYKTIEKIVTFTGLNLPSMSKSVKGKTEINLQLKNIFDKDIISNVAIQVSDKIQKNLIPENTEENKPINIKPGEEKEVHYLLDMADDSRLGLTPLELRMDFKDGGSIRLQTELKINKIIK